MGCAGSRVFAAMLLAVACSDTERMQSDSASDAATPIRESFESVALTGYVREFLTSPSATNYVAGVRVCQHEPRRCTQTTEMGTWTLDGLEPEREILLTYEKTGYVTAYQPIVTPRFSSVIRYFLSLVPAADLEKGKGLSSIAFTASSLSEGLGVDNTIHVRLSPDTGVEPTYFLRPDYETSPVIPEGRVADFGIFYEVPPGDDYELEYTMDDGECVRIPNEMSGWAAKDGRTNVTRVPAGAEATTYATTQACVRNGDMPPTAAE